MIERVLIVALITVGVFVASGWIVDKTIHLYETTGCALEDAQVCIHSGDG